VGARITLIDGLSGWALKLFTGLPLSGNPPLFTKGFYIGFVVPPSGSVKLPNLGFCQVPLSYSTGQAEALRVRRGFYDVLTFCACCHDPGRNFFYNLYPKPKPIIGAFPVRAVVGTTVIPIAVGVAR
jgi:hypothetical protein